MTNSAEWDAGFAAGQAEAQRLSVDIDVAMSMQNEILAARAELAKLTEEYDRYRKALARISSAESGFWGRVADDALYPRKEKP